MGEEWVGLVDSSVEFFSFFFGFRNGVFCMSTEAFFSPSYLDYCLSFEVILLGW